MIYLDTCYILKCYLTESGSPKVRELVAEADGVASCVHARVEFYAGVHRHLRENRLSTVEFAAVLKAFESDCTVGYWQWLELNGDVIGVAETVFHSLGKELFLRAADAMHLACAQLHGFTEIYSNDKRLLQAAAAFALQGINVISDADSP